MYGGISELLRGDAAHVAENSHTTFKNAGVTPAKLTSFATDGCATHAGSLTGVARRLWSACLIMVHNHCACHKLALAAKAAAENVPCVAKFFDMIEHLGRHHDHSSKRTSSLAETMLGMSYAPGRMVTSAFTRWLSHDAVTEVVCRKLVVVLVNLWIRSKGDDGDRGPQDGAWVKVGSPDVNALGLFTFMFTVEHVSMIGGPPRGELNLQPQIMEAKQNTTEPQ